MAVINDQNSNKRTLDALDLYDEGHHTGSDVSLFIGPLWVSQALSIYIRTGTNDIVVYPYSDPHYSRSLIGRYMVTGTLTVTVIEPDYLMRIIESVRSQSITEGTLKELTEKRKAMFQQTLLARLTQTAIANKGTLDFEKGTSQEEILYRYVSDYTERVTREAELSSLRYTKSGVRTLDPRLFELTIISGKYGSTSQSIDIYQDVKIVGTERIVANDDQTQTITYSIIARRKPELIIDRSNEKRPKPLSFVTENLLEIVEFYARRLSDEIINNGISIYSYRSFVRAKELSNNPYTGYIGNLQNKLTRFYGTASSYTELVWGITAQQKFIVDEEKYGTLNPNVTMNLNKGASSVEITTKAKFHQPLLPGLKTPSFSNAYGRIVSIDKEHSLSGCKAIAAVEKRDIETVVGGTLLSPLKTVTGVAVGNLTPPVAVDPTLFHYEDDELDAYTATTLWTIPFNIRGNGKNIDPEEDMYEETRDKQTTEVVQPLYSIGLIEKFSINNDLLTISMPVNSDLRSLDVQEDENGLSSEKPCTYGYSNSSITIDKNGTISIIGESKIKPEDICFTIGLSSFDAKDIPAESELVTYDELPYGIEVITLSHSSRVLGFDRFIGLIPIVVASMPSQDLLRSHIIHTSQDSHSVEETFKDNYTFSEPSETLSSLIETISKVKEYNNQACSITIDYDFITEILSPTSIKLTGAYFAKSAKKISTSITCPEEGCGATLDYESLGFSTKVYIYWLLISIPINRIQLEASKEEDSGVAIVHSTDMKRSRMIELYTLLRCDVVNYNVTIMESNKGVFVNEMKYAWQQIVSSIKEMFGTIQNIDKPITSFNYPVKGSMGKITSFFTSYTYVIDLKELVNQILLCQTSRNEIITSFAEGKTTSFPINKETISLKEAFNQSYYRNGNACSETEAYTATMTTIKRIILETLNSTSSSLIDDNDTTKNITIRQFTMTPRPTFVSYSMTEDGFKEFIGQQETQQLPIILGHYTL